MSTRQQLGRLEFLRRNPFLIRLWAFVRGREQEKRIRLELSYYRSLCSKQGIPFELDESTLRERLRERMASRGIQARQQSALHVVYATPLGNWEKHNIPPALKQFGTFTPFYLKEKGFDSDSPDWLRNRHNLDRALIQFLSETVPKVDVLVSYLSGWHISPETVRTINRMGIATCAFWWDDRLSFKGSLQGGRFTGSEPLASAYDLNLTNSSDSIMKYLAEGGLAMFWPEGANPEHFRPLNLPLRYDVTFIGARYGQRPIYINYLKKHGIKVEAFGPSWPNGSLSEDQMVEIYNSSRINLGFCGIGYSMKEMCLKGRDFEVPMSGALYLTGEQRDLRRVYKVGEEVVTYNGKPDLLAKIRYLLDHEDQSARIREAARRRCLSEHTWFRRFEKAFGMMGVLANNA